MERKLWFDLLLVKSVTPKVPIPQNDQTHLNKPTNCLSLFDHELLSVFYHSFRHRIMSSIY